jgi:hypothetical protein
VFPFISIMTFAAVVGLLISLNWWLGLLTGVMFAPVLVFCTRFKRRYKVLARRSQDQDGDLTTQRQRHQSSGNRESRAPPRLLSMRWARSTGPFSMRMFAFLIPGPPRRSCGT